MEFFLKWLLFVSINGAVTLSPGPAFAYTVKNASAYGRRAGILTALGLGLGAGSLAACIMAGMGLLISQSVFLFDVVKYCGAAYLVYLGIKALRSREQTVTKTAENQAPHTYRQISDRKAVFSGLLINLLNPKGLVFFTAILSQFITPGMPLWGMALYAATSVTLDFLWFSCVSVLLTDHRVKTKFMSLSHRIEQVCGGLMIALGLKLAFK